MGRTFTDRKTVIKRTMKVLGATADALSTLERDPPIVEIAELERTGAYDQTGLREAGNDVLRLAGTVNDYRRRYWLLETMIRQAFISTMRSRGFLPATSKEVDSLKGSLPPALIKGDDRIWNYTFDRYIETIAGQVGRGLDGAPTSGQVWSMMEAKFSSRIGTLVAMANRFIPELMTTRSRLRAFLRSPDRSWRDIKVKAPKVTPVCRPIRPVIVVKRPIPVQRTPRRPRKRLLGGPKREVIGPKGGV